MADSAVMSDAEFMNAKPAAPSVMSDQEFMSATPPPQNLAEQAGPQPPTLDERAQQVLGLDPNVVQRGALIPFGKTKEGHTTWAVPQVGVDLMKSFLLPGHVLQGGTYTPEDTLRFTMDYSAPATSHRYATGARPKAPSKSEAIANAPTADELAAKGGAGFKAAEASGDAIPADSYANFLQDAENTLAKNKLKPQLHPQLSAVWDEMSKNLGKDMSIEDLITERRLLDIPLRTTAPELADQRRIALLLQKSLDSFVDKETAQGGPLANARSLWSAYRKVDTLTGAIDRAQYAASGFENGLRMEFRKMLRNPDQYLRGYSEDEIKVMKQIVNGTPITKALRFFGKLGPNRSGSAGLVGTSIGAGAGAYAGGPIGAAAVPAAGMLASKGSEASTLKLAEYLRALAASGGSLKTQDVSRLADMLATMGQPTAATQLPQMTQPVEDQQKLRSMLMPQSGQI